MAWNITEATATARRCFGGRAVVEKGRAYRYTSRGHEGQCSVCGRRDCRRRVSYTIGIHRGLFVEVLARGHSWREALAAASAKEAKND